MLMQPEKAGQTLEFAFNRDGLGFVEVEATNSSWSHACIGIKTWCIGLIKKLNNQ